MSVMPYGWLIGKSVNEILGGIQGESQEEPMVWRDASKK